MAQRVWKGKILDRAAVDRALIRTSPAGGNAVRFDRAEIYESACEHADRRFGKSGTRRRNHGRN